MTRFIRCSLSLAVVLAVACSSEEKPAEKPAAAEAEPTEQAVPHNAKRDAYFGDLHVHTSFSVDSYIFGNRLTPRDAYKFARGEAVTLHGGASQKLRAPLDFAAVTDHAEGLEIMALCVNDQENSQYSSAFCEGIRNGDLQIFNQAFVRLSQRPPQRFDICNAKDVDCPELAKGPWQEIQKIAQEFNEPGKFTTLIGFEYSPTLVDGGMLHRNVIFRGTAVTPDAMGVWDRYTMKQFWDWLDHACKPPCQALAIPHNSNYSWGFMFSRSNDDGAAFIAEDWERRARFEPLVEITQHKGASECAFGIGTTDEECGWEKIFPACKSGQVTGCMREGGYARDALKLGLVLEGEIGLNPYKLGFIGSTDTHNSIPGATDESTFQGHHANNDDTAEKRLRGGPRPERPNHIMNPGGLAGVWAEANTRGDIWDALYRKETFATSGTRVKVRFFGSFGFAPDLAAGDASLDQAYAQGVPMGGDLKAAGGGGAPRFLIWALKDPEGASLDRIQIVKGWTEADGTKEAIYDVVCADGRKPGGDGTCKLSPATVGTDCVPSSGQGAAELSTVWTDPKFDATQRAFYYVRVFENPTCRWTSWEAIRAGEKPPPGEPRTIQERAWSSPIWYSP